MFIIPRANILKLKNGMIFKLLVKSITGYEINNIRFTEIPNKIFFNVSLLLLMMSLINNKKFEREDYYYIVFIIFHLLPYMIGFIYTRHMVPLYVLGNFYIFLKYLKYKKLYE